jgi:hypothetical protein
MYLICAITTLGEESPLVDINWVSRDNRDRSSIALESSNLLGQGLASEQQNEFWTFGMAKKATHSLRLSASFSAGARTWRSRRACLQTQRSRRSS